MADIFSKQKRSELMSGIKGKNTKPELLLRKALHSQGFRYKLHDKFLPGSPDLVLPKYNAVIQIHGCFWHLHKCHLFKWPSTNKGFWVKKISNNSLRDISNTNSLLATGWRLLVIWECAFKGKSKLPLEKVVKRTIKWLNSKSNYLEISGRAQ